MSATNPSEPPKRVYVNEYRIRRIFNAAGIWERVLAKTYQVTIARDNPCRYPDEPPGTRSQMWLIMDNGKLVALVHLYWRPDGTLGASGKPDPKKVVQDCVTYCLERPNL